MKLLWTLVKVAIVLAIAIPVSVIVLGTMVGLASLAVRLAVWALLTYGVFKLAVRLINGPRLAAKETPQLRPADPYYTSAMRELDRDLGESAR